MFNQYDGKGDQEYLITLDVLEAVKGKAYVEAFITCDKGVCWLELRQVSEWKKADIK